VSVDCLMQCWRGSDWSVHRAEYRARENALRGRRGHVPDCQDAARSTTVHGPERGTAVIYLDTQARKTTHGLDGQHQDVDRTLRGTVNQNDRGQR